MKMIPSMLGLLFIGNVAFSQAAKKDSIGKLIENKNFVFFPVSTLPMNVMDIGKVMIKFNGGAQNSGAIFMLNDSRYYLTLKKDTLEAYLPYFGRAYRASTNPRELGINFKSGKFDYATTRRKKGGWSVVMKPKDATPNETLTLDISNNGQASLTVISADRQPIIFQGNIRENDKNKK